MMDDGDGPSGYNTLYIDTNLDSHLALIVSDQDSVSDLKRKILSEHPLCFPSFGDIKINAIKVKRKGCFYHLTDLMLVKNAFHGVKKNWFLSVDVSVVLTNAPLVPDSKLQGFGPDVSIREVLQDLEMEVKRVNGHQCRISSSDSSEKIQEKCHLIGKGKEIFDNSLNVVSDLQCQYPLKEDLQNGATSEVKNKKKRKFDSSAPKVNIGSVDATNKDIVEQENTVPHNADDAFKGSFNDTSMGNKHIRDELERSDNGLKEMVVDVPANIPLGESPDARTTTNKKRKIIKKSEDLLCDCSNKEKKMKKKKKKSEHKPTYSNNDAAVAVPSCLDGRQDYGQGLDEAVIHENIVENGASVTVQEAVAVPQVLSHGVNTLFNCGIAPKVNMGSFDASNKDIVEQENTVPHNADYAFKGSLKDTSMGNKHITNEPERDDNGLKEMMVDVPANVPVGESPDARTTTERQKINKKSEDLICDSSEKAKKTKKKKSKQKPSYSNFEAAVSVPSCLEDIREESTKATLEARPDFDNGHDGANIHEKIVEEAVTVPEVLSHGTNEVEAAKIDKEKECLLKNDPKVMLQEKSMKEVVASSILLDDNRVVESGKISGRGKKVKKTKNTKGILQASSVMQYSVASSKTSTEPLKAVPQNIEKPVQPMQIDKPEEVLVNQDVKGRKKNKKKGVENLLDVQMKEQDAGHSIEETREAHVVSKKILKPDLVETSSENLINLNLQSDKYTMNKSLSLQFEAVVDEDLANGFADETSKKIVDSSASHGDGDIIKVKASDNLLPSQSLHKVHDSAVAFDNKVLESEITVRSVEAKNNSENVDQHLIDTSPILKGPLRSNDNHGSKSESGSGNSSTIQAPLRKNDKSDKQKGSSKVSVNKKEAQRLARPKIVKVSTTPARSKLIVNEIGKDAAALTTCSEISSHKNKSTVNQKRMITKNSSAQRSIIRKVSDANTVQMNISKRGKSLLAISSNIFKNDNGHSSEDEGLVDSDVSTRTPSGNFSSSDESESEIIAGSQDARRNVDDNNDLESILKSSRRFKKAMITASQTPIEDIDGLPVDYVPDSQPNF